MTNWIRFEHDGETAIGTLDNDTVTEYPLE
jgi:hypothetical protein